MEVNNESLREVAIKLANDQAKNEISKGPNERSIFILGSKGCGKTTLLNQLLERNEVVRPTLALDYSFTRKTTHAGQSIRRQVCHLWELGGMAESRSEMLARVPLATSSHKSPNLTTIILMLDLTRPKYIWRDFEEALSCLRSALAAQISKGTLQMHALSHNPKDSRISDEHPDKGTLDPFPLPLIVVGGKYDVFQDHEPEIKKRICKTLRRCCHLLAASLFFYSSSEPALIKKIRDILDEAAFGHSNSNKTKKGICMDYNKPMFISVGSDTWSDIGTEPLSISAISMSYSQWFPSEAMVALPINDPAADLAFCEDQVDAARTLKDEELKRGRHILTVD